MKNACVDLEKLGRQMVIHDLIKESEKDNAGKKATDSVQWLVAIAILLNQGIKDRIQDSSSSSFQKVPQSEPLLS